MVTRLGSPVSMPGRINMGHGLSKLALCFGQRPEVHFVVLMLVVVVCLRQSVVV